MTSRRVRQRHGAERMPGVRHYLIAAAVLAGAGLVGGVIFVWSGIYNVSAARSHFESVEWLLDAVRRQSVGFHSRGIEAPDDLGDRDLVVLGARHFEAGCAPCHGAPGRKASALAGAMLPEPPPLDHLSDDWEPREIFWIVQNGQKYTGMPHWIAPEREEEIWSVVALLEALETMEPAEYETLAALDGDSAATPFLAQPAQRQALLGTCAKCHGAPGEAPPSNLAPQLTGQTADYLARSLSEYRSDVRPSGIMQLFANELDDAQIADLAAAYANATPAPIETVDTEGNVASGAGIFELGLPEDDVPACTSCHGASTRFPALSPLSAEYVAMQLKVFRAGERDGTPYGRIMTAVVERLSDDDIDALAAFIGSLSAPAPARDDAPAEAGEPADDEVAP